MRSTDDGEPQMAQAADLHCVLAHSGRVRVVTLLVGALQVLGGCSYLESLGPSNPAPDTRIKLGQADNLIAVSPRDLERYTCVAGLLLTCERSGGFTYNCTCESVPVSVAF